MVQAAPGTARTQQQRRGLGAGSASWSLAPPCRAEARAAGRPMRSLRSAEALSAALQRPPGQAHRLQPSARRRVARRVLQPPVPARCARRRKRRLPRALPRPWPAVARGCSSRGSRGRQPGSTGKALSTMSRTLPVAVLHQTHGRMRWTTLCTTVGTPGRPLTARIWGMPLRTHSLGAWAGLHRTQDLCLCHPTGLCGPSCGKAQSGECSQSVPPTVATGCPTTRTRRTSLRRPLLRPWRRTTSSAMREPSWGPVSVRHRLPRWTCMAQRPSGQRS
mmetsp:Transcript_59225/g.152378  ORF Transcript_59225/g.152378 Transcript_59225/m.152378 type:complete len:276 (+) Transcript_59225:883-1710(+)